MRSESLEKIPHEYGLEKRPKKMSRSQVRLLLLERDHLCAFYFSLTGQRLSLKNSFFQSLNDGAADHGWWDELASALMKIPATFRRTPLLLIMPNFSPRVRHLTVPAVEPGRVRETIRDALEMAGEIGPDFAWDSLPAVEKSDVLDRYIFAERQENLKPLFDLLLSAEVLPDEALVPHYLDYENALSRESKRVLSLALGHDSISLTLSGGDRLYSRQLTYGWSRPLAELEEKFQSPPFKVRENAEKWLAGVAFDDRKEEAAYGRCFSAFFKRISNEISKSEAYYSQQLNGSHFDFIFLTSSLFATDRLEKFLAESSRARVQRFDMSYHLKPAIRASKRSKEPKLSSLTWLRVYQAIEHHKRFSRSHLSPFIPVNLRQQIRRRRKVGLMVGALTLAFFWLGLGSLYRYGQVLILESACQTEERQLAELKVDEEKSRTALREWHSLLDRFAAYDKIQKRQAGWAALFCDLERALKAAGGGWIEEFSLANGDQVRPTRENGQIRIAGRFYLDPEREEEASQKFDRFIGELKSSSLVVDVSDIYLSEREGHTVRFHGTIVVPAKEGW